MVNNAANNKICINGTISICGAFWPKLQRLITYEYDQEKNCHIENLGFVKLMHKYVQVDTNCQNVVVDKMIF